MTFVTLVLNLGLQACTWKLSLEFIIFLSLLHMTCRITFYSSLILSIHILLILHFMHKSSNVFPPPRLAAHP